ncbi:MAG: hypothetical protein SVM80_02920 [Halobacteriota archaeon]|nr:hypothetical protein [Halobacteriota archaeon]
MLELEVKKLEKRDTKEVGCGASTTGCLDQVDLGMNCCGGMMGS